ncbi:hypothetical protein [Stygiobacter electus]|uniref:Outer membrane protein beta-barrel domain-containing protein n=1 Tax=Stygiobacter electus TaxID=3032292 RepID=A0AAE3P3X8_9BACT|nr:hypothetical protein [Stygiobacter electus]MDF1612743.1 hypothetical protein [Stygiobacter electus]
MKKFITILFLFFAQSFINAQIFNESNFSLSYNYTTTSKLYYNPFSSDKLLRSNYIELNNLKSISFEFRTIFFENVFISLNSEYLSRNFLYDNINLQGDRAIAHDSFTFIPVELDFFYYLPFSNEYIRFFMGGGFGFYFGKFKRELGNQITKSEMFNSSYGINVSVGMDYTFYENYSVRFQMRFRDPELSWINNYNSNLVLYNDKTYFLNTSSFYTKINFNGINFSLGLVYNF